MSVKITYFVHSTTTDNEEGLATGWEPGELSKLGLKQAKELGPIVKDKKFDVVFCSDLKRAVETARIVFGKSNKIIEDSRLREVDYGKYTGKSTEVFKSDLNEWVDKKFPLGESYRDVENRIADFVDFLKENYDGKRVAIVSHHGPQLAFDVVLKGKSWEEAIAEDWRKTKDWRPGWEYEIED